MSYKTIDGLMRHLRDSGIEISGSKQKRQLMNTGYFHGYKGYRFLRVPPIDCLSSLMMRYMRQFNMTHL